MLNGSLYVNLGTRFDLQVQPLVKVKTKDGLGQLFSVGESSSSLPWRAGLVLRGVIYGSSPLVQYASDVTLAAPLKRAALAKCVTACTTDAPDGCEGFRKVKKEKGDNSERYDFDEFCVAGQDIIKHGIPYRLALPPTAISVGLAYGRETNTYVDVSNKDNALLREDQGADTWKVAALATHVFSRWATLEYSIQYSRDVTTSKEKGKYCSQRGTVVNGSPDASLSTDESLTDPPDLAVLYCREEQLGAPTVGRGVTAWVEHGIVDGDGASWRMSYGPSINFGFKNGSTQVNSLAFRTPISIAVASLSPSVSSDYKGILRLVPSIENRSGKAEREWRFVLSLELLAQRSLFSSIAPEL